MTKFIIVTKNDKGIIEISEEALTTAIEDAQKNGYDEGFQLGYLKGQSDALYQSIQGSKESINDGKQ